MKSTITTTAVILVLAFTACEPKSTSDHTIPQDSTGGVLPSDSTIPRTADSPISNNPSIINKDSSGSKALNQP